MAALPDSITVEQYRQLSDDGVHLYELHQGEIVEVTQPKPGYWELQARLVDLLRPKLVDWKKKSVTVMSKGGSSAVYGPGSEIPLTAFGSDSLSAAAIFE